MNKIAIFGVGLIGGSVALALKRARGDTATPIIVGIGRNADNLSQALQLNIIDRVESPATACDEADVILIAAPVAQTGTILQSIKPHLNAKTIITDVGSTKGDVLKCATEILGSQANQFIGGHPIAGAEKSGATAATADLFAGKNVVLTPTVKTSDVMLNRVKQLWQNCGANVSEMTAESHDAIFAAVSHLPHLLAFALVDDLASRPNAAQLFDFAASGFRDFTRIAGSNPEMWRDIALANQAALLREINAFENELTLLKQLLEIADSDGLQALFERASLARNNWVHGKN